MTVPRLVKILNRTKHNKYPSRFITRRRTDNFVNEWALLRRPPHDNKAKMFQALLRQMVITSRLCWNRKIRGVKPKYINRGSYPDLLTQFEDWDMMVYKRRRNAPAATVPPPVPAAAAAADDDDPDAIIAEVDRILADPNFNAPPSPKKRLHKGPPPGHQPPPPAHLFSDDDDDDDDDDAPRSNSQYELRQQKRVHYTK